MSKRVILLIIALFLPFSTVSCAKPPEIPKTEPIVSALCESEMGLPAGKIYSSDLDPTDKNYLSDRLISAYFGEPNIERYKKDWISYSIFIPSAAHPCEFAAIYCATPEALIDTSRMLASRIDSIKKLYGGKFTEYTDSAKVISIQNYAVLIVSRDADAALKILKKACR